MVRPIPASFPRAARKPSFPRNQRIEMVFGRARGKYGFLRATRKFP